jgi:putative membrane protein
MLRRALRSTPVLALAAVALVVGCGKGDGTADSARVADSIAAANPAPTPGPATTTAPTLTDANILAKLDADNVHDSTGGNMASTKGTDAAVKAYGRMMMKDHHAMRVEGMDLAKKANLTPEMPAGDADAAEHKAAEDSLNSMAKGQAWDKFYVDHAVMGHEKVLNFAQNAANSAQNADLKAMIEKATPTIQKHLDEAKKLQAKMSGTATTDTTKKP